MTIQAIETRYAGCRFRSRLEARWAVFLDRLNIPWEYEPQGYMVGPPSDRRPYLPDFHLLSSGSDPGLWVEVKGHLNVAEQRTLAYAVTPGIGLPGVAPGLLMLGDVPHVRARWACWHHLLRNGCDGNWTGLHSVGVYFQEESGAVDLRYVGAPGVHSTDPDAPNRSGWGFHASVFDTPALSEWGAAPAIASAYRVARSARFEHGATS